MKPVTEKRAYEAVCEAFRHSGAGITVADLAAKTALPLAVVKAAAPKAADEYNGSLSVTESGEILYAFPHGFKSRYRGAGVFLKKALSKLGKGLAIFGKWAFKVWIMLMLVGYFAFFMLLALAALLLSVAANSSNNSSSRDSDDGAFNLIGGLFNMIIRLWFYSELLNMNRNYAYGRQPVAKPRGKPLHKAIFSFIFGDGNPNATIEQRHKTAAIAFIQANKGVINLEEYIAITGKTPLDADREITAFCAEFGGSPEVTDDGTIVYRFDDLMLKAEASARSIAVPYKQLRRFSGNTKKMNTWFGVINTVNLLFGGYFLYHSLIPQTSGPPTLFNYLYRVTQVLLGNSASTQDFLLNGLGIVPVVFSLLFWIIPAVRNMNLKKENAGVKLENLRKIGTQHVYTAPLTVKPAEIKSSMTEALPQNLTQAQDTIIKELAFFGSPDINAAENGEVVYSFTGIKRDKDATNKYRNSIDGDKSDLGKVIFNA
ncbi:MAG: hypothetical protein LBK66_02740 [Spirochaetaceae bacterium]|jgi:hypothetical protein|nr:hypothetical protein [Spirochaetaceae bacterium]